jgi:hypothetical protein
MEKLYPDENKKSTNPGLREEYEKQGDCPVYKIKGKA